MAVLIILLLFVFSLCLIAWRKTFYWKNLGIPGPEPTLFIGNLLQVVDLNNPNVFIFEKWTKQFGKVYGIQKGWRNTLVISDPEMVHEMMTDKFGSFHERETQPIKGDIDKENIICWIFPALWPVVQKIQMFVGRSQGASFVQLLDNVRKSVNDRKRQRAQGVERNDDRVDFIDLFLDAESKDVEQQTTGVYDKSNAQVEKRLTIDEVVAQLNIFLLAGFDTTANTLALTCYYLAKYPEIQERVREEIESTCFNECPTYEELNNLKFTDAVMKETLRSIPIAGSVFNRTCAETTTLGSLTIEKGTHVQVDVFSLHHDKSVWGENAESFMPDRWLKPNVPMNAFCPFGNGPRICIGMRLAYLEEKLLLVHILKKFKITKGPRSDEKLRFTGQAVLNPMNVYVKTNRKLIDLLANTECSDFDETLKNAKDLLKQPKKNLETSNCSEETEEATQVAQPLKQPLKLEAPILESERENICNDLDWCELSEFRLKALASDFRPCNLNFSFHNALITHKMLNVYETEEEETDLHDFLTNEDLCIMSRHQNDQANDEVDNLSLIFQPRYAIRPNAQRVCDKINEFVDTFEMRFTPDLAVQSDFFVHAWTKNPFHEGCKTETPDNKKSKKGKKTKKIKKRLVV
ncbi:putative cytochrome P450 CYP13A8 [Aphelenchoides bicaudatus]|nr:putative cytochrome P450 CYP13A8 [Aphelenchoides bicaudatus]